VPLEASGPLPLFGAINYGAGWVARCDVLTGRKMCVAKVGAAPLTSLDCSPDGRLLACGNNDGELHLVHGTALTKLYKVVPHEIWITGLMLRPLPPPAAAALSKATVPTSYTAITLGGDNTVVFTPLPSSKLRAGGGLLSRLVWLSLLVLLVAAAGAMRIPATTRVPEAPCMKVPTQDAAAALVSEPRVAAPPCAFFGGGGAGVPEGAKCIFKKSAPCNRKKCGVNKGPCKANHASV